MQPDYSRMRFYLNCLFNDEIPLSLLCLPMEKEKTTSKVSREVLDDGRMNE